MNPRYYRCVTPKVAHTASTAVIEAYNSTDKIMEVVIQEYQEKRSIQQNRYYWSVMNLISKHIGYTKDELHELFKEQFLEPKISKVTIEKEVNAGKKVLIEKEVKIFKSTAKLTKKEFSEYMERIALEVAQVGFVVPPPLALGYEL